MKRKVIGAVVAVLLASAGTFLLLVYVQTAEDRALAGEEVVEVYVVERPIARGTAGEEVAASVALSRIPAKVVADGSVSALDALDGTVASVDLVPGEQLLSTRFITPEALVAQSQLDIPPDLHQVTVSLDPERALGGNLSPGDTVGVLASFDPFEIAASGREGDEGGDGAPGKTPNSTHMILHKVLVTGVQLQGGRAGMGAAPPGTAQGGDDEPGLREAPSGKLLVTLALDAPSVERVVFSAEHGRVWLSNEPETAPEGGTRVQVRDTVYR